MKKYLCFIGLWGMLLFSTVTVYAQRVAIKSNLLYDATTTMNLGLEIGLAPKWSLDLSANYNPWKFNDETRLRHWGVQPEFRYWFCEKFNGHFLGLHGHYAKYNMGGMSFLRGWIRAVGSFQISLCHLRKPAEEREEELFRAHEGCNQYHIHYKIRKR